MPGKRQTVHIVDTSVANIASLRAAFDRLECATDLTTNADQIRSVDFLVLPGVGAFAAGINRLRDRGLDEAIKVRIASDRPTLSVCLGMQMLCESSEENPGLEGLGVLPLNVQRFALDLIVPQLGWNQVNPVADNPYVERGDAYFANSYRIGIQNEVSIGDLGWGYATTDYGGNFVSAIWRGTILACQFHPELSGRWGLNILKRWAEQ